MADILSAIPNWAAAGAGGGAGFFFAKWFVELIAGRLDKREAVVAAKDARLDEATQKLIASLDTRLTSLTDRLERVEHELLECRAQHAVCEAELTRLKAIMQGWGEAKDHAQAILAAERLMDRRDEK